jgi:folate-binding protein YgfZ
MDQLESQEAKVGEIPCRVIKKLPGGIASAEFLVARERAEGLWNTLYATVRRIGGGPVGYQALNALRLETNVPWFGYDFGDKQIPHEAGLQDSHISYTKGCYTGQEIVERVRSRGQVNRVRVSLRFDGTEGPAPETPLLADEKEIGHITRTGFSPLLKAWIGMGYVRREQGKLGTKLNLPEGSATVIASPVWCALSRGEKRVHLLEQPGAIAGIHKDEFNSNALAFNHTADDGPCTDLAYGKIKKNLQLAADSNVFLGANE